MRVGSICKTIARKTLDHSSVRMFGTSSKFDCDGCSKKLVEPECKSCHKMVNYFKIFQIPQGYKVNEVMIKSMARDLQKEFHPDKCGEESELKEKMQKYSSYINEAKATLLNDLQRAVYLMSLKGVQVKEQIQVGDSKFMEQMFELQQQIEQANINGALQIKKRLQRILQEVQRQLSLFFVSEDLSACKKFVTKYKYVSSALTNVKMRIESLQQAQGY